MAVGNGAIKIKGYFWVNSPKLAGTTNEIAVFVQLVGYGGWFGGAGLSGLCNEGSIVAVISAPDVEADGCSMGFAGTSSVTSLVKFVVAAIGISP